MEPDRDPKQPPAATSADEKAPLDREGGTEASSGNKLEFLKGIVIPLIVVAVASLGTFAGAYYGADKAYQASREAQQNQAREERAKIEREKRGEIYLSFLDSATGYTARWISALIQCRDPDSKVLVIPHPPTNPDPNSPENRKYEEVQYCVLTNSDLTQARERLDKARNAVYIYGSDKANLIADKVVTESFEQLRSNTILLTSKSENYKEFQRMMCEEVPPNRREKC
ncbi:hypothetical protein AB0A74_07040 [Saccharothrix sp. NPDC042600]|uniref:hypothetical protein n=1 Tax=Saccharothrix TaxID=2071 RepID=UPI003405FA7E|nr:hypothetical protein GCM10017745_30690 [Saccharothrix mutabilis subsp. capreolus]